MSSEYGPLPNVTGRKLTYEGDFVHFPDDDRLRHELIAGEHYVTPSRDTKHQVVLGNLVMLVGNWVERHGSGELFFALFDVVLTGSDVVCPDMIYMTDETRARILTDLNAQGVPELMVEVTSRDTRWRDETIKRRLYGRVGVSEYWVVDPELDVVRVYRRQSPDRFARPIELAADAGDVLTTALLPGLDLPLARIFRL